MFFEGGDGDGNASDITITLAMPTKATRFGVRVLAGGDGNVGSMLAYIDYSPPTNSSSAVYTIPVGIDYSPKPHTDHGATGDTLQLVRSQAICRCLCDSDFENQIKTGFVRFERLLVGTADE